MAGGLDLSAARPSRPPLVWLASGFVPVLALVGWRLLVPSPLPTGDVCGQLIAPVVSWRLGLAVVVFGSIAVMAAYLHADRASLLLQWPSRPVIALSLALVLVVGPMALWLGPLLAAPFFGSVGFEVAPSAVLGALLAAVLVAVANATLEELTFRGALMGWGSRALGPLGANALQAVVFGVVHVGTDFTADPLPVLLAVGAGGFIAGVIARRTRSLLLPIAVHAAFDLPLYFAFACRLAV